MIRLIAFLRAINVGGHVVKVEKLRDCFREPGFSNVETFIASGNVIFESERTDEKKLEKKIEDHLLKSLGYPVAAFIRTAAEVAEIARHKPFSETDLSAAPTLVVGFLKDPLSSYSQKSLSGLATDIDAFSIKGREIFWLCRKKQSESKFSNAVFEKRLSLQSTFRSFSTIVNIDHRLKSLEKES